MILKADCKHSKIPAFTVMDMITGMVIMSIIMSLVFFLFSSFTKQVNDYSVSRSNLIALHLLKIELEQDILRSDEIIEVPEGFNLISRNSKISFLHVGNVLIKKNGLQLDTVFNAVSEVSFKTEPNAILHSVSERISIISMIVLGESKEMILYFFKNYSNQDKINNAILNEVN